MSQMELDHIGIAVKSLEEAFKPYRAMGWKHLEIEVVPSEKVKVGFVPFANGTDVELLQATSDDSVIGKFITRRGEGVHHICFRVENLEETLASLKKSGVRLIDEKPRVGARGCRVAFVHPSGTNGVLIELSEGGQ